MRHESHTEAKVIRVPSYLIWSSFRAFPSFSIAASVQICLNARSQQKRSFSHKDSYWKTSRIAKKGQKKIETQGTVWSSTLPWIRFQKIELRRHNYDLTLFPDTSSFLSKMRHPCKLITSAKLFLTNLCEHQAQVGQKLAIQRIRIWETNWLIQWVESLSFGKRYPPFEQLEPVC